MSGLAMLGMYDRAETAAANDKFWAAIRERLGRGPDALSRGQDEWDVWQSPDLTFAQTCGFPYRARLHDKITLIGTPDYGVKDCAPGYYCSVIVSRADDPRGLNALTKGRFAYNEALSQSGWAAPFEYLMGIGLRFTSSLKSGGHLHSARMVAEGEADFASLDGVTWKMLKRWEGFAANLRVVARTNPTPGLPYIAAKGADQAELYDAVSGAIGSLSDTDRETLQLRGLVAIPAADYLAEPIPPAP